MSCSRSPGEWYPSMPCRFPGPHPGGKLRGIWPEGRSPGPHSRLQVSRSTPRREVEGDLARGEVSRPTLKGEVEGDRAGGSPGPHPGGIYPSMH